MNDYDKISLKRRNIWCPRAPPNSPSQRDA